MGCPTREEYEEALKKVTYLSDVIARERKHRERLINELCTSHKLLDGYESTFCYNKEIIQKYEIYQELSENYK